MKLLAWDTSSKSGTVAALQWNDTKTTQPTLVAEISLNVDTTHSERILWAIDEVLKISRWRLKDVDILGVGVGPGSFTGIRIGLTTGRTLADALKKPLIGVSSMAALARPVAQACSALNERVVVVVSTDASKGDLFSLVGSAKSVADCVQFPELGDRGLWKRGVEEGVFKPGDLMKLIKKKMTEGGKKNSPTAWVSVGDGRRRYPDEWKSLKKLKELKFHSLTTDQIQGRYLGLLVWEAFQRGIQKNALEVFPRYLRAADAEIKLKAGLLPKLLKAKGAW